MKDPPSPLEHRVSPAILRRDARAIDQANSLVDTSPRQAQAMLAEVVRRNPGSPAAWRAYTLSLAGHYEQRRCRAALARWQTLAPDDPLIPAVHAGLAYSTLDFEEALRWIARALDRDPGNFQMLWAKAMSERFLGFSTQEDSFAKAREADPARYDEEAHHIRALERYGSLELQNAFECILLIGTAADEGDVARAQRLLEQSKREPVLPDAWVELRKTMEHRLEAAERRTQGVVPPGRAPIPRRRRRRARDRRSDD